MNSFSRSLSLMTETEHPGTRWAHYVLVGSICIFLSSTYFSIAVNSISLVLVGLAWAAIMIQQGRFAVSATPLDYAFLGYVIAEIVSTLFSVNTIQSLLFSKRLLLITIVYLFASVITREQVAKTFVAVLLGSAVTVAMVGVVKLLSADPATTTRLGIFQFYMTTSELMMIAALLIVPFAVHPSTPRTVRLLALIGLLPVMTSLYATVTRGAYVATAAGILFIALVRNKKLLVPFALLVVLLFAFAPPYVESRVKSIIDLSHPENLSRLMLWSAGLKIFLDYPLVGVGDIDLHDLFVQYVEPGFEVVWGHLHNVPLQFLVTLGIVGFLAVTVLFVMIFVTEWRVYQRVKHDWFAGSFTLGALATFVGFQVNGLTEWTFGDQEVVILLWITVGITIALGKLYPANQTPES